VPASYLKTRVLAENTSEEAVFLFGEWCEVMQGSVAFPEVVFPAVLTLKKVIKKASQAKNKNGKVIQILKTFLERVDEGATWVTSKRDKLMFAPGDVKEIESWEGSIKVEDSPVGKWMKVQRRAREKKRLMLEKARQGDKEILEDDD